MRILQKAILVCLLAALCGGVTPGSAWARGVPQLTAASLFNKNDCSGQCFSTLILALGGSQFNSGSGTKCIVNFYSINPYTNGTPAAKIDVDACSSMWLSVEITDQLALGGTVYDVTVSNAFGESNRLRVPLTNSGHPFFVTTGARYGDSIFGNDFISVSTAATHGSAIFSLKYKGIELVAPGTGSDFQTAYSLNEQGEGLNPTEGGSADDGLFTLAEANAILAGDHSYCLNNAMFNAMAPSNENKDYYYVWAPDGSSIIFCHRNPFHAGTHGTTAINYFMALPGMMESVVNPAYWLRPGEASSQGLSPSGYAVNTNAVAFDQTLSKRVIVGYQGNPNIIVYENLLNLPPSNPDPAKRSFNPLPPPEYPPIDYFQMSFYSIITLARPPGNASFYPGYVWNPSTSKFAPIDPSSECSNTHFGILPVVLCNFSQPVMLLATVWRGGFVSEPIYVGAYTADQTNVKPIYSIQQLPGSNVNALAVDFEYLDTPPASVASIQGQHAYYTFYVVGNYQTVQNGLIGLIRKFGANEATSLRPAGAFAKGR